MLGGKTIVRGEFPRAGPEPNIWFLKEPTIPPPSPVQASLDARTDCSVILPACFGSNLQSGVLVVSDAILEQLRAMGASSLLQLRAIDVSSLLHYVKKSKVL